MIKTGAERALTGIVSDPIYREHNPRGWHPECPERYDAVMAGIARHVDAASLVTIPARAATLDEVALCHTPDYIALVREEVQSGFGTLSTGDTDIGPRTYDAALAAVGGNLNAVDAVMAGKVGNAFCAVRPPGHHASANRGMGFCVFNNAAIAARYVQRQHGVERVLIVDWDVHHGNGTEEIFEADPTVFYFSAHEWPLYPGTGSPVETGSGLGKGKTLNCIFPAGTGGDAVIAAFRERLLPAMDLFQPEFVVISAGFDARKDEPISLMALEDEDFGTLTRIVKGIAARYAAGRLVSTLEGGYDLKGLARAAGEHVRVLADADDAG